ncbi:MarR family transcriptional regulator [Cohnella lubricantis]|uniref:MarR family transcriptional regulator n=1 Tax=Cohnella lubricantis TaxID=2163172 RepID=A0A841T5I1_9BACL|nr:MarR family transcriptional regulator [Cohnella lubricantis]MBB6676574.1 MarR family transcriptional regulator [Cohnella lubricantis]MBP2117415.1 DNA-binding MarR family transcriptional regulator [Cohnella lubricantis]
MEIAAEFVKSWMKLTKEWHTQLEAELAPQLTEGQLQVLELMMAFEPMKPSDLLPHLETTPAAVTTLLDRMERNGLVRRERDAHDRRIVWVSMTELGRSEAERGLKVRSSIVGRSLERLSLHNRQLLMYLIGKVAGTREAAPSGERAGGAGERAASSSDGERAAAESAVQASAEAANG